MYKGAQEAIRSQYWMLTVMVAFTCFGLWLLSAVGNVSTRRPGVVCSDVAPARLRPARPRSPLSCWGRVALPALAATAVVLAALASLDPGVLCVLPALALALLLALRRYPGERTLAALRRSREGAPQPRACAPRSPLRWSGPSVPRGGLLLACSLANRPPPGALLPAR